MGGQVPSKAHVNFRQFTTIHDNLQCRLLFMQCYSRLGSFQDLIFHFKQRPLSLETVDMSALTMMDGCFLFQRALSDIAPIKGKLAEVSCNFKLGF